MDGSSQFRRDVSLLLVLVLLVSPSFTSAWSPPFRMNPLTWLKHQAQLQDTTSTMDPSTTSEARTPSGNVISGDKELWKREQRWLERSVQPLSCNKNIQSIVNIQSRIIMSIITDFLEVYAMSKFGNTLEFVNNALDVNDDLEYLKVCNEENIECMLVLPSLPEKPHQPPSTEEEAKERLAQVLGYTRQYSHALELLFLDQSLHEDSFIERIDEIYRQLEILVNYIVLEVQQCEVSPDETTIRNLSRMIYTRADIAHRTERGFRALRQCMLGLQYILDVFPTA